MAEQRFVAIDRLQQNEIGDLRYPASAGLGEPRRQRLAALVQQAVQLVNITGEGGYRTGMQHWGNISLLQDQLIVRSPFSHFDHAQRRVGVGHLATAQ